MSNLILDTYTRMNGEQREIDTLSEQVAHLSLFKPAVRTSQHSQPVRRIGETNYGYSGVLIETDEDFAERAGQQVPEVME